MEHSYLASGGREVFLSWEAPETDTIVGYLRLRFPSGTTEGALDAPVIRELKVLGREVPVGGTSEDAGQVPASGVRALSARARRGASALDRVRSNLRHERRRHSGILPGPRVRALGPVHGEAADPPCLLATPAKPFGPPGTSRG